MNTRLLRLLRARRGLLRLLRERPISGTVLSVLVHVAALVLILWLGLPMAQPANARRGEALFVELPQIPGAGAARQPSCCASAVRPAPAEASRAADAAVAAGTQGGAGLGLRPRQRRPADPASAAARGSPLPRRSGAGSGAAETSRARATAEPSAAPAPAPSAPTLARLKRLPRRLLLLPPPPPAPTAPGDRMAAEARGAGTARWSGGGLASQGRGRRVVARPRTCGVPCGGSGRRGR